MSSPEPKRNDKNVTPADQASNSDPTLAQPEDDEGGETDEAYHARAVADLHRRIALAHTDPVILRQLSDEYDAVVQAVLDVTDPQYAEFRATGWRPALPLGWTYETQDTISQQIFAAQREQRKIEGERMREFRIRANKGFAQALAHLGMEEAQVGRMLGIVGGPPLEQDVEDNRARFERPGAMRPERQFEPELRAVQHLPERAEFDVLRSFQREFEENMKDRLEHGFYQRMPRQMDHRQAAQHNAPAPLDLQDHGQFPPLPQVQRDVEDWVMNRAGADDNRGVIPRPAAQQMAFVPGGRHLAPGEFVRGRRALVEEQVENRPHQEVRGFMLQQPWQRAPRPPDNRQGPPMVLAAVVPRALWFLGFQQVGEDDVVRIPRLGRRTERPPPRRVVDMPPIRHDPILEPAPRFPRFEQFLEEIGVGDVRGALGLGELLGMLGEIEERLGDDDCEGARG